MVRRPPPAAPGGNVDAIASFSSIDTPLGRLLVIADADEGLRGLYFADAGNAPAPRPTWRADDGPFADVRMQIDEYFAGRLRDLTLPVVMDGTPFQRTIWAGLRTIPYGETRTYGEQATAQGRPRSARAVGAATARNPIALVVPCHRVVGHDGSLTGSAMGMQRKQWLINHERGPAGSRPATGQGSDGR